MLQSKAVAAEDMRWRWGLRTVIITGPLPLSYGASAVTRTSDRGHVAEAKNQGHRSERALNQGFQGNPSRP